MRGLLSKKQINELKSLQKKKARHELGYFLAEGIRTVEQILENRCVQVVGIFSDQSIGLSGRIASACYTAEQSFSGSIKGLEHFDGDSIPCYALSSGVFSQLVDTENSQGVMALCKIPEPISDDILLSKQEILLAIDRVQDPGNMGTLIRTAVWFGVCGLVLSGGSADIFHPKVVRSTAGATGVLPWVETDLELFLEKAFRNKRKIYLLDGSPDAESYRDIRPSGSDILVAGNEANGISLSIKKQGYPKIKIDASNDLGLKNRTGVLPVESLNVAIATAIAMAQFQEIKEK
ncbi:RNA methyltransferase [Balneolaceae bacterium ANBcel3]|nr:RNA methyltransferase [Balneolaceae bacterium ANBcel3]